MVNKKYLIVIYFFVLLGLILGSFSIYKYINLNKEKVNVFQTNTANNSNIAFYVKDGSGEYTQSNTVPIGNYILNKNLSRCLGDGEISYDKQTGQVTYSITGQDRCYVYFDEGVLLSEWIDDNTPTGYQTIANNGLKRFIGTSTETVNNYLCLDNSSLEGPCNDEDMYRIIGITSSDENLEDNLVKIVKNISVGSYKWDGGNSTTTGYIRGDNYTQFNGSNGASTSGNASGYMPLTWNESCLNKRSDACTGTEYSLNDTDENSFLFSIKDSVFKDKIENVPWHCYENKTLPTPNTELESPICTTQKIGLLYITDYILSYNGTTSVSGGYKSWLILSDNQWSISSYGYNYEGTYNWGAWYINSAGGTGNYNFFHYGDGNTYYHAYAVRPVFYLNTSTIYKLGAGTENNPIRIK